MIVLGQDVFSRSDRKGPALHPLGRLNARGFEHGRSQVHEADRIIDSRCNLVRSAANDERHPQQPLVVNRPFEQHLVIAKELPMVAGEDHQCVVRQLALVEDVQDAAHLVVDHAHHPEIAGGHDREQLGG